MQADDSGPFHRLMEVAIDSCTDVAADFLDRGARGLDPVADGAGQVATIDFVVTSKMILLIGCALPVGQGSTSPFLVRSKTYHRFDCQGRKP